VGADGEDRNPHVFSLAAQDSARWRGLSVFQWLVLLLALLALAAAVVLAPAALAPAAALTTQIAFGVCAAWRILLAVVSLGRPAPPPPTVLPTYAVLVALHDEAAVAAQLVSALAQIDYPADRLEGFLLLEAHDQATLAAIEATDRPEWLRVLIVPPGFPRTKPRALNYGLARCRAEYVTVYDAEDRPDPLQLQEAVARFAADHGGRMACLQAPLRIVRAGPTTSPFLDRQFALEYASLFEVTLPALTRLGLPFPLGGTSNHFRADVLREIGGWDAHNVTEDADLGFRLHREGYRLGVLTRPTLETPPGDLQDWLPQRTRWMKGFMQTWGVHTRRPWRLGARGALSLIMTLGMALASAAAHAPSVAWVSASILVAAAMGLTPAIPQTAVIVLSAGVLCAWLTSAIGARRAELAYGPVEMLEAPAYWSLLSVAFGHAVWRLIAEPFAWDKTPHRPDVAADAGPTPVPRLISGA
jgi:cellulose synthase/poly-beta-1,6-N-acetylglucosamine synthase-like glycosyltransferase